MKENITEIEKLLFDRMFFIYDSYISAVRKLALLRTCKEKDKACAELYYLIKNKNINNIDDLNNNLVKTLDKYKADKLVRVSLKDYDELSKMYEAN